MTVNSDDLPTVLFYDGEQLMKTAFSFNGDTFVLYGTQKSIAAVDDLVQFFKTNANSKNLLEQMRTKTEQQDGPIIQETLTGVGNHHWHRHHWKRSQEFEKWRKDMEARIDRLNESAEAIIRDLQSIPRNYVSGT